MALQLINQNSKILEDYQLEMLVQDTLCKSDVVMKKFISYLANVTHPIAGVLGRFKGSTVA